MKFGIFALLFLLFSVTAQEIGFPDGKYKGPWNVEIGQEFGGRHHSTVLNSINRVEKMKKEQPELSEIIRDITTAVNGAAI